MISYLYGVMAAGNPYRSVTGEATDQKKKEIVEERKQKQYEDQVETWRKETDIKVDKKEWKKVDFEDQGVNVKQTTTDSEK